jgi:hypothetical protein
MRTYGSETMELIASRDHAPVFATAFGRIAVEYAWARIEGTKESEKKKEAVGGGSYEGGRGPQGRCRA